MNRQPFPHGPLAINRQQQDGDLLRLVGEIRDAGDAGQLMESLRTTSNKPLDTHGGFSSISLDLAATDLGVTAGRKISASGYALLYRRDGSTAGGRLDVQIGGQLLAMVPGSRIRGHFKEFDIKKNARSAAAGTASLLVITRPDADYEEPAEISSEIMEPVTLLGTVAASPTFIALTEDTQPTGDVANRFTITGFRRIRVIIDGQAANTATSFDLIPWSRQSTLAIWEEQGVERITFPAPDATARFRVLTLEVRGDGEMAFELRNLLPALQTQIGLIVQAIE